MRFGGRRDDEVRVRDEPRAQRPVPVHEGASAPVTPSKRLQRIDDHFHIQLDLLAGMREEFAQEMEPLHGLLAEHAATMQRMMLNLDQRLRPLNEYADAEESNLNALEQRMNEAGADHVARSFAEHIAAQRARIAETREQIEEQSLPFVEYGDEQREALEVALSRFDADMEALEANLAEQRRVMMRMLDGMRSETFGAVKDFLLSRQEALSMLAASGSTDPNEIGRSVQQLRRPLEALAGDSPHIRAVLDRADQADRRLGSAAPVASRPRAVPASAPQPPEAAADLEDDDEGETA